MLCRGVLMKSCFENMQQIYRRTPMPKCDFNKVVLKSPRGALHKEVLLKNLQNSQKNACARVSFLIKFWYGLQRCFHVNFAKFLRTPFLTEHRRWLLVFNLLHGEFAAKEFWSASLIYFCQFSFPNKWAVVGKIQT